MSTLGDGSVFRVRTDEPYKPLRTVFTHAVRQAGMAGFTFHDLRHTFASRLIMGGVDLPTVQALMGHKDISMTPRYAHLSSEHKQRAVRALESLPPHFPHPAEGRGQ